MPALAPPIGRPFQSGHVPRRNAGGRSKVDVEVVALARQHTRAAIARLVDVMNDAQATPTARVRAAEVILERGWGRPSQDVHLREDQVHHVKRIIIQHEPDETGAVN